MYKVVAIIKKWPQYPSLSLSLSLSLSNSHAHSHTHTHTHAVSSCLSTGEIISAFHSRDINMDRLQAKTFKCDCET